MPEKSAHYSLDVKPVQKVNGTLDGLYMQVEEAGKESVAVAPVLYLQELYKNYQSTGGFERDTGGGRHESFRGAGICTGIYRDCFF